VVVAARTAEAAAIARAVHERRPHARVLVGDGVPLDAEFIGAARDAVSSVYGATWWHPDLPDPRSRAFAARFEAASGALPSAAEAMYFDAILVAAQAVHEVGPRPLAIKRYLSELGSVRPPYHGVTGLVSFAPRRPVNLVMTHFMDGALVMVSGSTEGT
jgi:ABC-type branched-subunit amino acid transport system substrate-binding protein